MSDHIDVPFTFGQCAVVVHCALACHIERGSPFSFDHVASGFLEVVSAEPGFLDRAVEEREPALPSAIILTHPVAVPSTAASAIAAMAAGFGYGDADAVANLALATAIADLGLTVPGLPGFIPDRAVDLALAWLRDGGRIDEAKVVAAATVWAHWAGPGRLADVLATLIVDGAPILPRRLRDPAVQDALVAATVAHADASVGWSTDDRAAWIAGLPRQVDRAVVAVPIADATAAVPVTPTVVATPEAMAPADTASAARRRSRGMGFSRGVSLGSDLLARLDAHVASGGTSRCEAIRGAIMAADLDAITAADLVPRPADAADDDAAVVLPEAADDRIMARVAALVAGRVPGTPRPGFPALVRTLLARGILAADVRPAVVAHADVPASAGADAALPMAVVAADPMAIRAALGRRYGAVLDDADLDLLAARVSERAARAAADIAAAVPGFVAKAIAGLTAMPETDASGRAACRGIRAA